MNQLKTPSGIHYLEDFISKDLPTIVYQSGAGERSNNGDFTAMKRVAFYTKFYATNKGKYNFFIPLQTLNSYSWVYPITDGVAYGVGFIRYIREKYGVDVALASHSMGSSWSVGSLMPDELKGLIVVSGSGDYKGCVLLGQKKVPAIAYHGESDNTAPNTFAAGKQACITWYQNTGGGLPTWITYPGVGHNADQYAYAANSGLKEWIDKLFAVSVPPIEPVKDPVIDIYSLGGEEITFVLESGKVIKK